MEDEKKQNVNSETAPEKARFETAAEHQKGPGDSEIKQEEANPEAQAQTESKAEEENKTDPKNAEIAELKDQLLRARAEFANYKRRTTEEMVRLGTFTTVQVVKEFLKVLDNFERAEQSSKNSSDAALITGLQKIRKQFEETLKKLDVEEIKALNQQFDPNLHEAVMRGENPDLPEDSIDLVLEKGYKLREQVIRHSKVRVISK